MAAKILRLGQVGVLGMGALLLLATPALGQAKKTSKAAQSKSPQAAVSPLFQEAIAKAKQRKQPLVVFGVAEGCQRCAALKEGLTAQPEIKELMTQYVTAEIPFGGREFAAVYSDIGKQDAKYNQAIGAPSVFIFTLQGAVVYAGPNDPNGMQPNETFIKLLQEGIAKNGGAKSGKK